MKIIDKIAGVITGWLESADDAHDVEDDE